METIRPSSGRPNLCTVIDLANARAARAVGLKIEPHAFSIGDLVVLADGAQGRIVEFKAHMAMVALGGARCGTRRAAALSTMRRLEEESSSFSPAGGRVGVAADDRRPHGDEGAE